MNPSEIKMINLMKVHYQQYKRYPTIYEIADIMNVRMETVKKIVVPLIKKGIMTSPDKNGNIELWKYDGK